MNITSNLDWQDDSQAGTVNVNLGDVDILSYTYKSDDEQRESPRPFFHPVRTPAGDTVSIYRPHDHVWHKGIAWSLPHFGDDNFWGGPSYRRGRDYQWLPNNGRMDHVKILESGIVGDTFRFSHELSWQARSGLKVVEETRSFEVAPGADRDSWILLFESAMTNVSGQDVQIGSPTTEGRDNAGYGGLFWRGPRSFTGGSICGPSESGGEELRGARSPWMAFVGQHDETSRFSTVLMLDDDRNAQHPPQWFARSEPFACLGPAPFFSEEVTFAAGGTMVNRYAVVIADGESTPERLSDLAEVAEAAVRHYQVFTAS
ncbi:PmoA family protein [Arthrobacter sp. ISL-30]|uniref:DUF6807 domain-containing protein n=1 Tax=Arthrobacter sp. ISL-30 TaxID=2819109 RepID=UPI001BED27D1|nr:PmoA family protein [Arthrobacter sp. ISL-30]MBT2512334.1 PmoA family protein [Arthrobacter sp. ISL-30]